MSQCFNCINPSICHLENIDDITGHWCNECNICIDCEKEGKQNLATNRIYWTASSGGEPITLYTDRCEGHTFSNDCHCFNNTKNIKIEKFIYE